MLVFLGGTAAKNNWRIGFIAEMVNRGASEADLFNPVVADWNAEAQAREETAKANANFTVYYIADPMQEGNPLSAYSMVESAMALYDQSDSTVVVFDDTGMSGHPLKAMNQCCKVLKKRFPNGNIFGTRQEAIEWLAQKFQKS